MNNIEISVVMSVYNCEKYIKNSIDSILNQSFKNYEFIIVNDGSTDNTEQILIDYADLDCRIKIINNKDNIGLTKSLNNAIGVARGKYIARMDADDISHELRFEEQINILNEYQNVGLATSWIEIIDEKNKTLLIRSLPSTRKVIKLFKYENLICHGSTMFRKEIFDILNGYNVNLKYGQDMDLWRRIFHFDRDLFIIEKPLYKFRISTNNISITEKNINSLRIIKNNYLISKKLTWLSSLYLQQRKTREANIILKQLLFKHPNFLMKIIYYIISFLPKDWMVYIMFDIKYRVKAILKFN